MSEKPPKIEEAELTKEQEKKVLEDMVLKMEELKKKDKKPNDVNYDKPPK